MLIKVTIDENNHSVRGIFGEDLSVVGYGNYSIDLWGHVIEIYSTYHGEYIGPLMEVPVPEDESVWCLGWNEAETPTLTPFEGDLLDAVANCISSDYREVIIARRPYEVAVSNWLIGVIDREGDYCDYLHSFEQISVMVETDDYREKAAHALIDMFSISKDRKEVLAALVTK